MGGKTGTSTTTSTTQIPKEVLARYNAVNAYASDVATTPFQPYSGQFVSGLTPTQQAGIGTTNQYSQYAQPYYNAATQQLMGAQQSALPGISAAYENVGGAQDIGSQYAQYAGQGIGSALQYAQPYQYGATQAAMMGSQGIQPGQLQTQQYMNPYIQSVAAPTYQALQQQQQEQMAGQLGNAIRSGAFGGDRAGLVAANLARQQQLGMAQAMSPIYQQGYQQALQTAQQQQGVQLSAEQANRAALQNLAQQLQGIGQQGYGQQMGAAQQYGSLGQQQYAQGMGAAQQLAALAQQGYGMGAGTAQALAGLGTQAQQSGLQGAQAQLGAGTLEQQTQQADLTARYQQFLQERGYPFQVAQFLANIAMGTGALSGSSTASTSSYPMPFFSDRRVKHDVKEIGKTHDGQPIYSFKYNGDNSTQIGLMAQDVEKKHPEAVGEYGGVKTVDYKKATEGAERAERYEGGLVPASMGGAVTEPGAYMRGGYAYGGDVLDPNDLQALLAQQQQALGPFGEMGLYGRAHGEGQPFAMEKGIVPKSKLHVPKMLQGKVIEPKKPEEGLGSQALQAYEQGKKLYNQGQEAKDLWSKLTTPSSNTSTGGIGSDAVASKASDATTGMETADKAKEGLFGWGFLGLADGGVVPRKHFVKGGTAFNDPYGMYEVGEGQVPEEVLEIESPEPPKSDSSKSATPSSGSGMSDLASLASLGKTIFSFLPLKDGGVVPRHGYENGGMSEEERARQVILSDVGPFKFREDPEMIKGVDPRLVDIARHESVSLPEGQYYKPISGVRPVNPEHPSLHPLGKAMDVSIVTPEGKEIPNYQDPLSFKAYEDPALVGRGYQKEKYPELNKDYAWGGYFSGNPGEYGAMDLMHRSIGETPKGGSWETGLLPEQAERFAGYKPSETPAKKASQASGLFPEAQKWLGENQSWLTPLGAGLRGMVQSKSPFLGGAMLEGLGSGLEAVGPAQKALADIGLTKAQTVESGSRVPAGYVFIGFDKDGKPMYTTKAELYKRSTAEPIKKLEETQQQVQQKAQEAVTGEEISPPKQVGPVNVFSDKDRYSIDVAPTSTSDKVLYGILGDSIPESLRGYELTPQQIQAFVQDNDNLKNMQARDEENARNTIQAANLGQQKLRDLKLLSTKINQLSDTSLTGEGPGAEGRQALAYAANWVGKIALGDQFQNQDWSKDIESGAVINKLRQMFGTREAGSQGIRAGFIADALSQVSPSGGIPKEAANDLMASMFVASLAERDFEKFANKYQSKGTSLGVNQAFKQEFDPVYNQMKPAIKAALTPVKYDGQWTSAAQLLMEGKVSPQEFDKEYGIPGISRAFLGG